MKQILTLLYIGSICFGFEVKNNLSEYKIYLDNPKNLKPTENFIPYELITPLFTDYAFKHRMIYIPNGEKIKYAIKYANKT